MATTKLENPEEYFTQLREKYETQRKEARVSLDEAEGWLRGLDALQRERTGKKPSTPSEPTGTPTKQPRGKRKEVLHLIQAHPDGLLARQVLDKLGVSGDDKQKAAVNAALFQLKKQGHITHFW
jgi:hypothetical protein